MSPLPSKPKAIIFDCFGVVYVSTLAVFARKHAIDDSDQSFRDLYKQHDYGFLTTEQLVHELADLTGEAEQAVHAELFEGLTFDHELLGHIKTLRPKYKTAMLTNVNKETWNMVKSTLESSFDVCLPSCETGLVKPEAAAYTNAAKRLGLEVAECVLVDDREDNCQAAWSLGMAAILYKDFASYQREIKRLLTDS